MPQFRFFLSPRHRAALVVCLGLAIFAPHARAQFTQQGGKLVGSGAVGPAQQGWSVAVSADGNTAIVGGVSDTGTSGAAWIFTRSAGVWRQGGKLVGSGGVGSAGQGWDVAISGDGSTAIESTYQDDGQNGAAWVFARNANGTWSQQGDKLTAAGLGQFGMSVALSLDGNTAVVGSGAGTAVAFTRVNGTWKQPGTKLAGVYGRCVAISGDANTIAATDQLGTVQMFARGAGSWQPGDTLSFSGGSGPGQFCAVGVSSDGNSVIAGAAGDNFRAGSAWAFTRAGGSWTSAKLAGAGAVGAAQQGSSVAISGDGNTALVGGPSDYANLGAVWVFTRANGSWTQQGNKLTASGESGAASLGGSVAISADAATAIAGGPTDSLNPGATGAAWVFATPPPVSPERVAPRSGSGFSQTFTLAFTDKRGWQDLTVVDVLINDALDGRHACYLAFVPAGANSGSLFLVDDAGDAGGPYSGMVLPGYGSVENSQCGVSGAGASVGAAGDNLTLILPVTFKAGFAGRKVVYLAALSGTANSGWQPLGTWQVPGAPATGPAVDGMTLVPSGATPQPFMFTFTDTNGWQDISVVNVLINDAINGAGACYLAFVPGPAGSGAVLLVNDAGDAGGPFSGMLLPGFNTVSNSQCSISGSGSQVTVAAGSTLILTLAINFSQGFGNRIVYASVRSNTANSGWQAIGSVSVP
jgi:hypothetical protein